MNKKGFTLVELMVVIVIIGILAAVAIPRMMAAADRARAAEGPQTLGAISRMQHAHRVSANGFRIIAVGTPTDVRLPIADAGNEPWQEIGFDAAPFSRFFAFSIVAPAGANAVVNDHTNDFRAEGAVADGAFNGADGAILTITRDDDRGVDGGTAAAQTVLRRLVGSWLQ